VPKEPLLFQCFPALGSRVPWLPLREAPTPVEPLPLGEHLGPACSAPAEIWVKRDDLTSSRYGGNKVRKLEYLLAAALEQRRPAAVTSGAYGSNHVLATAIHGGALGLRIEGVLYPQPVTPRVCDQLDLMLRAGACLHAASTYLKIPHAMTAAWAHAARHGRRMPALIAPGGSSPLGVLGYVDAALELRAQVDAGLCPAPDMVYLPLGTGSTAAGLLLGLALAGLHPRVMAVRVAPFPFASTATVLGLAHAAWLLLWRAGARTGGGRSPSGRGLPRPQPGQLSVVGGFLGPGYGHLTPAADEAVAVAAVRGLSLEPVYTGKTLAGLLDHARSGRLAGKRVLFLNTHSSADLSALRGATSPPCAELLARLPADLAKAISGRTPPATLAWRPEDPDPGLSTQTRSQVSR
jgi:1-aminocyclopropane-1-carboxylate deaminase/D-cysteine desulfhydrase-like pyridoxal-dependent ACC family enzyme